MFLDVMEYMTLRGLNRLSLNLAMKECVWANYCAFKDVLYRMIVLFYIIAFEIDNCLDADSSSLRCWLNMSIFFDSVMDTKLMYDCQLVLSIASTVGSNPSGSGMVNLSVYAFSTSTVILSG